LMMFNK